MNLGVARATLPDLSPAAQAALDQAHAEAKEALVELRGIVRGTQVAARVTDGRLQLRIVDDGAGGADPTRGSGLTGLRQRVASVDGELTIESPPGGPTVLEAVIPCGS